MADDLEIRHGRDKQPEGDDPVELVVARIPGGDPETMATCLIEEYARMGMGEEEILELFRQPLYQTHRFYERWGEARIRHLIGQVLARSGRMQVKVTVLHHIGGCDA